MNRTPSSTRAPHGLPTRFDWSVRTIVALFLSVLVAATGQIALATPAQAMTVWVVDGGGDASGGACDSGHCPTLRTAIGAAGDGDTIVFNAVDPIVTAVSLDQGQLLVNKNISIMGNPLDNGTRVTITQTKASSRVFEVASGATVTLQGLIITGGAVGYAGGGGVYNQGTLTVKDSTISGNSATYYGGGFYSTGTLKVAGSTIANNQTRTGGGIYSTGPLEVTNSSTIEKDTATESGGGIYSYAKSNSTVSTLIKDSEVSGNTGASGGGIVNFGSGAAASATLDVEDSEVSGNNAAYGGGISNWAESAGTAKASVTGSQITNNKATGNFTYHDGGGIANFGDNAEMKVENTTVTGNEAKTRGGGLYNRGHTLEVAGSTVSANTATTEGGGIYSWGILEVDSTTVNSNQAPKGGGIFTENGTADVLNSTITDNTATTVSGAGGRRLQRICCDVNQIQYHSRKCCRRC